MLVHMPMLLDVGWLLVLWLCSNMKHSCTQYTIDSWKCDHFEPFAYPHVRRHINNALIHAIQLPNPILVDLYPTVIISNITINCAFIYTVHDSGNNPKYAYGCQVAGTETLKVAQIDCHRVFNHLIIFPEPYIL